MGLIRKSPEVFLAEGPISRIGKADIDLLVRSVAGSSKGRARINAHPESGDRLHEMIIALQQRSYIRPHKHPTKSESFHIVDGEVDIVVFDDAGEVIDVVALDREGKTGAFYYRMSQPFFHTLLIKTPMLVVHETTNGPFRAEDTVFADFAPADSDIAGGEAYLADVARRAHAFQERRA